MDFMKWLNSLDELLYEVMSWLVFWPLTLWRTLTRPLAMMDYADAQLELPQEAQYRAALSPPVFLALGLVLSHGVAAALGQADQLVASRHGLGAMITDETSALLLRLVVFAAFPLVMAIRLIRRKGVPVDRDTLRLPFYAQCYPAGAFALFFTLGGTLDQQPWPIAHSIGPALVGSAFLYLLVVETMWFRRRLALGYGAALGNAALGIVQAFLLLLLVGFLVTR
jgi:hypothetical protein